MCFPFEAPQASEPPKPAGRSLAAGRVFQPEPGVYLSIARTVPPVLIPPTT